jgi:hypothetical protein
MDGSQSLLVFEGAVRVHGLFDFLLNDSFTSHGEDCDVPVLQSPSQFAHAALSASQPRLLGMSDSNQPGQAQHRLELRGAALPPWVLDRLAAVLLVTQVRAAAGCWCVAPGSDSLPCGAWPSALQAARTAWHASPTCQHRTAHLPAWDCPVWISVLPTCPILLATTPAAVG